MILIIDTLEHFENCFQLLRDIKTKSTYKIFQLSLDISVKSVLWNKLPEYRHATGHLHFFSKDVALEVIQDAGYQILDCFYAIEPFRGIGIRPYPFPLDQIHTVVRALQRFPRLLFSALNQDLAARIFGDWKLIVLANRKRSFRASEKTRGEPSCGLERSYGKKYMQTGGRFPWTQDGGNTNACFRVP